MLEEIKGFVSHSGADPIHLGKPNRLRIQIIQSLTFTDVDGIRYYRETSSSCLRQLWKHSFRDLNQAIDREEQIQNES